MVNRFPIFLIGLLALTFSGCASLKTIESQAYLQDKPRVDQNREQGNSGYLLGEKPADSNEYKETRKIFVWEVSKRPMVEETDVKVEEELTTTSGDDENDQITEIKREEVETTAKITLPDFDDKEFYKDEEYEKEATAFQDYVVQKDDTLQKIAKKFYGSYGKWPRIYDANRDVIDNPDRLQPGISIRIPAN